MIEPDGEVTYAVHGLDANGSHLDGLGDLASKTRFSIPLPGSCRDAAAVCTAAKPGTYQVTGTIDLDGGTVTGTAVLHVVSPGRLVGLELDPTSAKIEPGGEVTYAVHGLGDQRKPLEELGDLAEQTVFSIEEPGSCTGATCTAATAGDYAVTGTIDLGRRKVAGEATLHVRPGRATLALDPNVGPVGTKVTASGTGHGSCIEPSTHVGTIALLWDQRPEPIATATVQNADFTTSFEVPAEPGPHRVRSTCLVDGAPSGGTLAAAAFRALAPTLVLDPVEGAAGSKLVASGDEYPLACADAFVLQFDQVPLPPRALERTRDPGEGWVRFRASTDVPATAGLGPHKVSVRCPVGGLAPTLATAPFVVTVAPTTTTTTTTTATTVPPTTATTVPPTTATGTSKPPAVPRQPRIAAVTPGSTPAGTVVEVRGETGSCNRAGTLTFHGPADVPFTVAAGRHGDFVTRIPVPTGTFPKAYGLELSVGCNGQAQRARATLTVVNHRPVAADDSAGTPQDAAVPIAVTANDTDPDGDGDYPTLVFEHSPPAHGTTETQPDGTMTYTPDPGFVGQDRFRYRNCDVLAPRNAAGRWQLACATATVTVSTNQKCLAAATDVHQFQVAPVRGARGAKLRIIATVDRRLVACQLRFLLGGAPFGGDVAVAPDGGISQDRSVPGDATPGSGILRLATTGGQVLAGAPFEVLAVPPPQPEPKPWWRSNLYRLLAAGLAFLLGVSGRATVRRWRQRPRPWPVPEHVRVEPHPRPPRVTADQDPAGTPNPTIQLRPDADAGIQTTIEVTG